MCQNRGVVLLVVACMLLAAVQGKDNVAEFVSIAAEATRGTFIDKIEFTHAYSLMYGMYLLPMLKEFHAEGTPVRFLEIGLGCWDNYAAIKTTTKKSVHIWEALLNTQDSIYVAEFNEPCAADWQARGIVPARVKMLLGDQADASTVQVRPSRCPRIHRRPVLLPLPLDPPPFPATYCNTLALTSMSSLVRSTTGLGGLKRRTLRCHYR